MIAKYLIRFDDVCPTMDWGRWEPIEAVLLANGIKPVMAVIPDNQDQTLHFSKPNSRFWDRVRTWQSHGWTIGLHGYQHCYATHDPGILGVQKYSEFSGLDVSEQRAKLQRGVAIFRREGVNPDLWVAPAHSFDENTLIGLREVGVNDISDGLSVYPYVDGKGMFWVPQQVWRFRHMPFGVWTICIHLDDPLYASPEYLQTNIAVFKDAITSYAVLKHHYAKRRRNLADKSFYWIFHALLACRQTKHAAPRLRHRCYSIQATSGMNNEF